MGPNEVTFKNLGCSYFYLFKHLHLYRSIYRYIHIHEPTWFRPWTQKKQAPPPLDHLQRLIGFGPPPRAAAIRGHRERSSTSWESKNAPRAVENVGNPSNWVDVYGGNPAKRGVVSIVSAVSIGAFKLTGVCLSTKTHPGKLTWNPKMEVWNRIFLFNWVMFGLHVNFQPLRD